MIDESRMVTIDLETYPNIFTMSALRHHSMEMIRFEISPRKNDLQAVINFMIWCKRNDIKWVGFNNVGFDYPVMHHIFENAHLGIGYADIYEEAMRIIDTPYNNRRDNVIPPYNVHVEQVDLMLIHHFDNVARTTSLKVLEVNMRSPNVSDLPFPVGQDLTGEQADTLIVYNDHDVHETYRFYVKSLPEIEFRLKLNEEFGVNWTNKSDVSIGSAFFVMQLEHAEPQSCWIKTPDGSVANQTIRGAIDLNDAVFPYIKFERPEFQAVVDWFRQQTIHETKGVFSDVPYNDLGDLAHYAELKTKKRKITTNTEWEHYLLMHPDAWWEAKLLQSGKTSVYAYHRVAATLNTVIDGFTMDFGTGGLHGAVNNTVFNASEEMTIELRDVASYYPNLTVVNRLYPEHLGELFCDIYAELYQMRKATPKSDPKNKMLKLALNGAGFGATNSRFSPFFDSLHMLKVTINGQLLLCLLAEWLLRVPGLKLIQINTDGIAYIMPKSSRPYADYVCKIWENYSLLSLDCDVFTRFCSKDVNNYIAVYEDGKVKRKGAYTHGKDLGWHQNHSSQIVAIAAEAFLVHGDDIEDTIAIHNDLFDFVM